MKFTDTYAVKKRRTRRHKPVGLRHRKKLGPKSVLRRNRNGL